MCSLTQLNQFRSYTIQFNGRGRVAAAVRLIGDVLQVRGQGFSQGRNQIARGGLTSATCFPKWRPTVECSVA